MILGQFLQQALDQLNVALMYLPRASSKMVCCGVNMYTDTAAGCDLRYVASSMMPKHSNSRLV